jgi:hypothetical protein
LSLEELTADIDPENFSPQSDEQTQGERIVYPRSQTLRPETPIEPDVPLVYTIPYARRNQTPDHPDYWNDLDLVYINRLCYLTAVSHPDPITETRIVEYLTLVNTPAAATFPTRDFIARWAPILLLNIQDLTRDHANRLRQFALGPDQLITVNELALQYQRHLARYQ